MSSGCASGQRRSYLSIGIVWTSSGLELANEKSYSYKFFIGGHVTREVACFFAPTSIVLAYRSSLVLLTELRSLLFRIDVAEYFVYAPMSFFSSELLSVPVDEGYNFEGVTALVESSVLLPSPSGIHSFVSDVGLLSVFQNC